MKSSIRKWGNSAAIRIPAAMLDALRLRVNSVVELREEGGKLIVEALPAADIDTLVAGITPDNLHGAVDFGHPVGREILQVTARGYIPEAGDIVWLAFDPHAEHEQAGHRPALVLSPASYNGRTGLMVCCPMTTQIKGYPFEVSIASRKRSVVLADQIKSLDWMARKAQRKTQVTAEELSEVRRKAIALIGAP